MIDRMDQGIGEVFNTLKQNGEWDNTLILFLSDNGGSDEGVAGRNLNDPSTAIGDPGSYEAYEEPWANVSNTPFQKYKRWTYEGGIATPLIAHWPEGIKSTGIVESYAHVIDIMATCVDLAKIDYPETYKGKPVKQLRGESLQPVFTGQSVEEERTLYWEHEGNQALRKGKWKIVTSAPDKQWQLFDMEKDPTELQDVSNEYEDITKTLSTDYKSWAQEVGVKQKQK